jgi:hypothetical protein
VAVGTPSRAPFALAIHDLISCGKFVCVGTGVYEALELRDKNKAVYMGKGVLTAVRNVNTIIGPALVGKNPAKQDEIDNFMVQTLDGTRNDWGSVVAATSVCEMLRHLLRWRFTLACLQLVQAEARRQCHSRGVAGGLQGRRGGRGRAAVPPHREFGGKQLDGAARAGV